MKRKDDAEERKQIEKDQQKSVERTHWIIEDKSNDFDDAKYRPKFQIEYDSTGQNYSGIGRQSFNNFNKELVVTSTSTGPMNKIPKLTKAKSSSSGNSGNSQEK